MVRGAGVGCVLVQRAYAGFLGIGGNERASRRAEAVACDEEVESLFGRGVGEGDLGSSVGLVDRFDRIAKYVLRSLLRSIIQDLCKCSPQDLSLRRETLPLPTTIDSELRPRVVVGINECYTFFTRRIIADGTFESHAPYDFKASAGDICVLPYCPQCGGPLDYCCVCAGTGKPEGERLDPRYQHRLLGYEDLTSWIRIDDWKEGGEDFQD